MMQLGEPNTGLLGENRNTLTKPNPKNLRQSQSFKQTNFRASNALQSIASFHESNRDSMKRASMSLGMDEGSDVAELKIENGRLKTTLMILNQKMKMHEDQDDLSDKWKSQLQSKDGQISIMNDQLE